MPFCVWDVCVGCVCVYLYRGVILHVFLDITLTGDYVCRMIFLGFQRVQSKRYIFILFLMKKNRKTMKNLFPYSCTIWD